MNQIKVLGKQDRKNENTITTREVADMLGTRHSDVLVKLEGQMKPDGTVKIKGIIPVLTEWNFPLSDYFIESTYKDDSGKENKEYLCTKLGCDFLANKFTGDKGIVFTAKYVKRFRDMEETLNNQISKMLPTTYKEALIQLVEQLEENEKLIGQVEELTPKAEYTDSVLNKDGLIPVSIIANDLGMTGQKLNSILWANGIQHKVGKVWVLNKEYDYFIEKGYADFKSYKAEKSKPSLQWTELGRKWIIDNIDELKKFYEENRDKKKSA